MFRAASLLGILSGFEAALPSTQDDRLQTIAEGCTSILVTKGASANGAMTSQTNDCMECDFRLGHVPAKVHSVGATRSLYSGRQAYPRYIGEDRGEVYKPSNTDTSIFPWEEGKGEFAPIASVPEIERTYAYLDGSYAIQNEFGLSFGESTCGAKLATTSVAKGGKAQIDIREMSRIAAERCRTSLCAVKLMGSLAESMGYFGADETLGEAGESLQITDAEEAWVFHVLADDTGTSAVWAAQRVPDGHITVVANQFTIRRLVLNDPENFRFSKNIHEVAERAALWNAQVDLYPLDFAKTFGNPLGHLSPYATRRVWRVFTIAAPSLLKTLPSETGIWADDYPFSVKPDRLLTVADVTAILRDYYEGTPYDLTRGIAAGPYGDPSRFDLAATTGVYAGDEAISVEQARAGMFERAISLYRCAHSFVTQTRGGKEGLDLIWFGQYAPHASQYVPIYPAAGAIPSGFTRGSLYSYDEKSSYWTKATVGNYAARFFRHAIGDVKALQEQQEGALFSTQSQIEARAKAFLDAGNTSGAADILREHSEAASGADVAAWNALLKKLFVKYKDGQRVEQSRPAVYTLAPTKLFYPFTWLMSAGYWKDVVSHVLPPLNLPSDAVVQVESGSMASHAAVAGVAVAIGIVIGRRHDGRQEADISLATRLLGA